MNQSIDQLINQLSVVNINVPRVDAFKDIFEFVNEFESITAPLTDEQQLKLLIKAFPPGRLRNYYESVLKPLITPTATWQTIKAKIIEHYSDTEDRDRQLKRLQGMRFVDDGHKKLFDYVEELIYTFSKAFEGQDDGIKIRYVKSNLPATISQLLINNNDYNNPANLEQFLRGVRQYDRVKANQSTSDGCVKLKSSELVTMMKEVFKDMQQEKEEKRHQVAALRPSSREGSPGRDGVLARPNSPRFQYDQPYYNRNQQVNNPIYERKQTDYYPQRSPSPARRFAASGEQYRPRYDRSPQRYVRYDDTHVRPNHSQYEPRQEYCSRQASYQPQDTYQSQLAYESLNSRGSQQFQHSQRTQDSRVTSRSLSPRAARLPQDSNTTQIAHNEAAFSTERYYRKFGRPPTPCPRCQLMHWERHCPDYLN